MSYECPSCRNRYVDLLDHIRKNHPYDGYSTLQLQPAGLAPCPKCGTPCRGQHGIRCHLAKAHAIPGSSTVSTRPRRRLEVHIPARPVPSSPPIPRAPLAPSSPKTPPSDDPFGSPAGPSPSPSTVFVQATRSPSLGHSPDPSIRLALAGPSRQQSRPPSPTTDEEDEEAFEIRHPIRPSRRRKRAASSPSPEPPRGRPRDRPAGLEASRYAPRPRLASAPSDSDDSLPSVTSLIRRARATAGKRTLSPSPGPATAPAAGTSRDPQPPPRSSQGPALEPSSEPSSGDDEPLGGPALEPSTEPSSGHEPSRGPAIEPSLEPSSGDDESLGGPALEPSTEPSRGFTAPAFKPSPRHRKLLGPILWNEPIQLLLAYSRAPIPEKKLHPRHAKSFSKAADRLAKAFIQRPSEKGLLHFLLLPRILGIGLEKGGLGTILGNFPSTLPPPPPPPSPSPEPPEDRYPGFEEEAKRLLEAGFISRAAKALMHPAPIADETPKTIQDLESKHPIGPRAPFRNAAPAAGQVIPPEAIEKAIRSIDREKAPGLSGWTRPLLDIALQDTAVKAFLRLLADMIRQGRCPGGDLLRASRLVPLTKAIGSVRPIAVGDIIYRVATKAVLISLFRPEMLLPSQLGVGSKGGVEPAIFLLEEAITGSNPKGYTSIASLDLKNAFNSIDRTAIAAATAKYAPTLYRAASWAYNSPSLLVTKGGTILASSQGVRQGDPLGPLLFSLGYRPTLEALQQALPSATIVSYLDDTYCLGKGTEKAIPATKEVFRDSPLSLNIAKSSEKPISALQEEGLKALGTFIGPIQPKGNFLEEKIWILRRTLSYLKDLPKQHALALLKASSHLLLRHLLRQLRPDGLGRRWDRIDNALTEAVASLAARDRALPTLGPLQLCLIALPDREGGLGIPAYRPLSKDLYNAAREASREVLDKIEEGLLGPREGPTPLPAQTVLDVYTRERVQAFRAKASPIELATLEESKSYLGRRWLRVLPTKKQYLLADTDVTEALRNRLCLPPRSANRPCGRCGDLVTLGHEDTCRAASRRWIARHDGVVRALAGALATEPSLEVEKEPLANPATSLRADLSVRLDGSTYYYDVQVVAISKASARDTPLDTLQEAYSEKKRKYKSLGAFFHPLILSAGGLMALPTAKAYRQLQKQISPIASDYLGCRLSLLLVRIRAGSAESIRR